MSFSKRTHTNTNYYTLKLLQTGQKPRQPIPSVGSYIRIFQLYGQPESESRIILMAKSEYSRLYLIFVYLEHSDFHTFKGFKIVNQRYCDPTIL